LETLIQKKKGWEALNPAVNITLNSEDGTTSYTMKN
jgi:hypothetical protein